jgi:hypothetical protein
MNTEHLKDRPRPFRKIVNKNRNGIVVLIYSPKGSSVKAIDWGTAEVLYDIEGDRAYLKTSDDNIEVKVDLFSKIAIALQSTEDNERKDKIEIFDLMSEVMRKKH